VTDCYRRLAIQPEWSFLGNISKGDHLKHRARGRILLKINHRACEDGAWNKDLLFQDGHP